MRTGHGQVEDSALLATVLELVTDGIWDWNIHTGTVCRSPRWYTLLGYKKSDIAESTDIWHEVVHIEDAPRVLDHLKQYLQNQISKFQIEYRLKTKHGRYIWVQEVATIIDWNADGTPARLIGAFQNIDERKSSLDQLRFEKRSLEELVEERTKELLDVNAELSLRMEEAERLAEIDPLTGLANRYRLEKTLELEVERANRFKQPLSILSLDVDDFKKINDQFGHATGDMVLVKFSRLIKKNIREIDLLARWGGDEFMIILPNTALDAANHTAEKLRQLVQTTSMDKRIPLTISLGVAQIRPNESAMRLSIRVDNALYQSKENGKNRISA